jgi:hypothetical protein
LHLKDIFAVLFNVFCLDYLPGEFSAFADGDETHVETQGEDGGEDKPPGVETDDYCRVQGTDMRFEDVELI